MSLGGGDEGGCNGLETEGVDDSGDGFEGSDGFGELRGDGVHEVRVGFDGSGQVYGSADVSVCFKPRKFVGTIATDSGVRK